MVSIPVILLPLALRPRADRTCIWSTGLRPSVWYMMHSPFKHPAIAYWPSGVKATDVIIAGTDTTNATLLSGILQSRSLVSRDPARKKRSSRGWN